MDEAKTARLQIETRKLADLRPHPSNPRLHPHAQVEKLRDSLDRFGFIKGSIVVSPDGTIVTGHGIYEALQAEGYQEADIIVADLDDGLLAAFLVADNKLGEESRWDMPLLNALFAELEDMGVEMEATAFEMEEIEEIRHQDNAVYEDDFDVEGALEEDAVTQTGDLWHLGDHRLLCGDSTDANCVEYLMGGEKAAVLLSDPPYGINIVKVGGGGKTKFGTVGGEKWVKPNYYMPIHGDDKPFDPIPFLDIAKTTILFGGNYFSSRLPDSSGWLCWDKKPEGAMRNNFADCELIWTNLEIPARIYRCIWQGLLKEGEQGIARQHPTQKPIKLLAELLNDFSEEGSIIYDPFLGSGTTLIAADQLDRICYGMEIEPRYGDVVCKRYINHVGTAEEVWVERDGAKLMWDEVNK